MYRAKLEISKLFFGFIAVIAIAVSIITGSLVAAIVAVGIASFNLGILVGERGAK